MKLHLDYAVQFWLTHYRKATGLLESVQRRMSKRTQGMTEIQYEARLKVLNLHFLERGRLRGDLMEVFMLYIGDMNKILSINSQDRTRYNGFMIE